jgi:hypothetical protein
MVIAAVSLLDQSGSLMTRDGPSIPSAMVHSWIVRGQQVSGPQEGEGTGAIMHADAESVE